MKKTYINPELQVVTMNTQYQMLAGSLNVNGGANTLSNTNATGDALGRGDDLDWEDEEF